MHTFNLFKHSATHTPSNRRGIVPMVVGALVVGMAVAPAGAKAAAVVDRDPVSVAASPSSPAAPADPTTSPTPSSSASSEKSEVFDISAIGDRVSGAVGDRVKIKVGIRNTGTIDDNVLMFGTGLVIRFLFQVPEGTEVVSAPSCGAANPPTQFPTTGVLGLREYQCSYQEHTLKPGQEFTATFDLKITNSEGKPGTVKPADLAPTVSTWSDDDSANDVAQVIVDRTGTLPVTGPPAWWLGGSGVLLVGLGLVLLIATRRRASTRPRFVVGS